MKANELMIGDWVYARLIGKQEWHLIQVKALGEGVNLEYKPIPLTEEILKANGWEKNKFSSAYINHVVPFRIDIGVSDIWLDHEWDDYYNAFSFQYVHELQHALRLCGLNELADNFKVND